MCGSNYHFSLIFDAGTSLYNELLRSCLPPPPSYDDLERKGEGSGDDGSDADEEEEEEEEDKRGPGEGVAYDYREGAGVNGRMEEGGHRLLQSVGVGGQQPLTLAGSISSWIRRCVSVVCACCV